MAIRKHYGIPFGAYCRKITRGVQLTKMQTVQCHSAVPTGYRYITLATLESGMNIELDISTLPYFDPAPLGKNVDQFCIKKDMILLSKNDTPYKIELVGDIGNEKIVATGNIYMITADPKKILPACLCFWLKSNRGMMTLKNASATTNDKMKWISIKQLKEMLVPEFSAEEQGMIIAEKIQEVNAVMMSVKRQVQDLGKLLCALKNTIPDPNEQGE